MSSDEGHIDVKIGSDRGFGMVFAAVFVLVALWPLTAAGGELRIWSLVAGVVFLLVSFTAPNSLAPLNKCWFRFGLLLGKVMTPVVLALLFFLTITPTGLLMRLMGKDLLRKKIDKSAPTYWIARDTPPTSMKNQF